MQELNVCTVDKKLNIAYDILPAGSTLIYPYNSGICTCDSCYAISDKGLSTVSTFYSCTICVGSPCIVHDRTSCHHISWACVPSKLNVTLICKLCGSLMCLAYFLTCSPWVFVQPGTGRCPVDRCRNYLSVPYRGIGRYVTVTKLNDPYWW